MQRGFMKVFGLGLCALACGCGVGHGKDSSPATVTLKEVEGGIEVRVDGELFTVYQFDYQGTPIFYPVIGPSGENLTRNFPMVEGTEGEETDHPHHRSIWFGHRDVNGHTFWGVEKGHAMVVQREVRSVPGDPETGAATILTKNDWEMADGTPMASDEREYRIRGLGDGEVRLDYTVRIFANRGSDLLFGNQKDGLMAIRVAPWMNLENRKGEAMGGSILNSEGVIGKEAWGKRADWVDYFGTSPKGQVCGVAMFDHPENLRHPTWWHARNYGLLSANPFGQGDFEKGVAPENAGDFTLAQGEQLELKYGFYFHRGSGAEGKVAKEYSRFAGEKQ